MRMPPPAPKPVEVLVVLPWAAPVVFDAVLPAWPAAAPLFSAWLVSAPPALSVPALTVVPLALPVSVGVVVVVALEPEPVVVVVLPSPSVAAEVGS